MFRGPASGRSRPGSRRRPGARFALARCSALRQNPDVLVLPAGTGHCNAGSTDLLVIGAYPDGMSWDLRRGDPAEHEEVLQNIAGVPLPKADPVEGADGSLLNLWGKT